MEENWMIGDFHIHSRFSRACSSNINFENLVKWAKIKGLHILGTGDFTHPVWFEEIKKLRDNGRGFYYYQDFPFIITGEISLMYTQESQEINSLDTTSISKIRKGRRIHLVLLVPDIQTAEKINAYLDTKGRRDYDGRPIFKISCEQFAEDMMKISEEIEIIPAHCMTPWFGIFGSATGFDGLKEAFGEQEKNIHAIETGMSADPEMLWQFSFLNNKSIVSFSDSHSFWPFRLGREATIFNKVNSYKEIIEQIRNNSFIGTIETDPAYGKYHWDGHRNCNFSCSSEETEKLGGICPVCKRTLTIGVENRVNEIGDQIVEENRNRKKYYILLPLHELISFNISSPLEGKKTWQIYHLLIEKFENEFNILLNVSKEELMLGLKDNLKLVKLILDNREGKLNIKPGYDGRYGEIIEGEKQTRLF